METEFLRTAGTRYGSPAHLEAGLKVVAPLGRRSSTCELEGASKTTPGGMADHLIVSTVLLRKGPPRTALFSTFGALRPRLVEELVEMTPDRRVVPVSRARPRSAPRASAV